MENNKIYGQDYVIKGQICFNEINIREKFDFCFSVANQNKELVDLMIDSYKNSEVQMSEDKREALDNLKRSALAAVCCKNIGLMSSIFEDILNHATDIVDQDLSIGDYLKEAIADEDNEIFTLYNYIELEAFQSYWEKYKTIFSGRSGKNHSDKIADIIEIACFLYNGGYKEIGTEFITIESATVLEDSSAKTLSGVLTWDD